MIVTMTVILLMTVMGINSGDRDDSIESTSVRSPYCWLIRR